jgi:hypothetical protein
MPTPTQGATNLLLGISKNEGYGVPGTLPTRSNNPTAITSTNPDGVGYGLANSAGVINYGDVNDGINAGYNQINRVVNGQSSNYPNGANTTISDFASIWTTGETGSQNGAASDYMHSLGITDPNTKIGDIVNGTVATTTPKVANFSTQVPPNSPVSSSNSGSNLLTDEEAAAVTLSPTATAYTGLTNNGGSVNTADLVPMIVVTEGLNATPWYEDKGLITGNPRLRQEVQPVSFQIMLHDNSYFILADGGKTGKPIEVELNASMKSVSWTMKHLYNHQRTRTAHHITMWGMQADVIEGQCTTGVFMNQFGLTDYFSTRTINDSVKQLITGGTLFNGVGSATNTALTPPNPSKQSAAQNGVLGSAGNLGGVVSQTAYNGSEDFESIMDAHERTTPYFTQSTALRVGAQDAFMEFLSLFKMNGNVWFWNKLYEGNVGETRDWTSIQAWSPILGVNSAQKNSRNNDVITRGSVIMKYRNFVYQGYFKSLQWTMDAASPYSWTFNFVFQVERTVGQQFIPSSSF